MAPGYIGDYDVPDMLSIAELLATRIAGAKKVVMPGVAHLPNLERPVGFNQIVLDFLREQQSTEELKKA